MTFDRSKLINALLSGLHKGWHSAVWLLKILIPISLLTFLIDYGGWLNKIDFLLTPLMHVLSLPSAAALPLLIGLLTGIYGGIAAMAVLPFTTDQMTLMAIFLLISHNLFQESIIQGCSGLNGWTATIIRLGASIMAVMLTAPFLGLESQALPPADGVPPIHQSLGALLPAWGLATLLLALKIIIIIVALMVLLECMKTYRLIRYLGVVMNPLMRLMGLDQKAGFLWMTAVVFGLSYGGAIIVEEVKSGQLESAELTRLQLSIGVNHSVIEDPVLFLPLGIGPFWLWIPRLLIAVLIVWGHMALVRIKRWVRIGTPGNRRKRSGN
jgi:spore maturation protein SpmB